MKQPLTLLLYERLLPGGQLVNRLQDLGYRVQVANDASGVPEQAAREKPLLVLMDLECKQNDASEAIARIKENGATSHIPIIGYSSVQKTDLQTAARAAGANLVVNDTAILAHLSQFLEQALQVE